MTNELTEFETKALHHRRETISNDLAEKGVDHSAHLDGHRVCVSIHDEEYFFDRSFVSLGIIGIAPIMSQSDFMMDPEWAARTLASRHHVHEKLELLDKAIQRLKSENETTRPDWWSLGGTATAVAGVAEEITSFATRVGLAIAEHGGRS